MKTIMLNTKIGVTISIAALTLLFMSFSCKNDADNAQQNISQDHKPTESLGLESYQKAMNRTSDTTKITLKNQGLVAAVSPTKLNVLYFGVENPVQIAVSNYPGENISVSMTNGVIRKVGDELIVHPKRRGNSYIFLHGEDGKMISKFKFRVKTIPDPKIVVAGEYDGCIEKSRLIWDNGIYSTLPNSGFDLSFEIVSFEIRPTNESGAPNNLKSDSDKFTPEQIKYIKSLKKYQGLIFENTKVKGPDGSIRILGSTIFTVL